MRWPSSIVVVALGACGGNRNTPADTGVAGDAPPPIVEPVHLIGRFDAEQRFAWPGTQIATRFAGTSIDLELSDTGASDYFDITLDGTTTVLQTMAGPHVYPLATGLAEGEHDLVVTRRTEAFWGTSTFHGFPGATLVPTPRPARLIELIGDSITCGYGVLGIGPTCPFAADTEAETHAWGTYAAAALEAGHVSIAYSGIGMARNGDGSTTETMPARYLRTLADDPSTAWGFTYTPDVIVIDLGTNDFATGDPGTAFRDAYVAFVRDLRARFPSAWIVLATSPMLGDGFPQGEMHRTLARAHLDAIAATLADARVQVVEIAEQLAADGYGCDYHPSELTDRKMAEALVAAIRPLTGW
jgi:lysophospholipase L1-like esterase